ncbi:MAG: transcription-repair coupling factor [Bacteroidetes bacterium]|nr:transcription-repair coupling factor [Bacteroidota bacterium]
MDLKELIKLYSQDSRTFQIIQNLIASGQARIWLKGIIGSQRAIIATSLYEATSFSYLFILPDKEAAAYFYNDLENIFSESTASLNKKRVLFFPSSYKKHYQMDNPDSSNVLIRTEVLTRFMNKGRKTIVVTYPEALCEKVIQKNLFHKNLFRIQIGDRISLDFFIELLIEYDFDRVDFVVDPGQFSVRGGIIDVFSFSNELPYRIEFSGDLIESLRTFNPDNQLSAEKLTRITLLPNTQDRTSDEERESVFSFINAQTILWFDDIHFTIDKINSEYEKAGRVLAGSELDKIDHKALDSLFMPGEEIKRQILEFPIIETGKHPDAIHNLIIDYNIVPQPSFNKNFELLIHDLNGNSVNQISNIITIGNPKQLERIYAIFEDIQARHPEIPKIEFSPLNLEFHEGFIDKDLKIACYTDHQIFDRYQRFHLKEHFSTKEALTLREMYDLKPGDYVTHIDHGIGRFDGLEKIDNNGRQQEALRLVYANNDLLYISIHSLHRIAKYVGKEGTIPTLNRLGSNAWENLKNRTKKKVKDIAKDLIRLYAERKSSPGFQFSPDTYLQNELEASFIYEDTPDQIKATLDVKKDMEVDNPMDRLICGDVGFGKTEVAIRSAFKAVADSKQVAVLVPTTILALQHYHTFSERLKEFPCRVDYINRFKSTKEQKLTMTDLADGKVDILIGTHRLISKDIIFKDLGLLIIDEEQKFGVAAKEKIKHLKVNVDTLTLTATPIPRTLQFSMMGARDLSIINTPPPNRFPIQTELHSFNEDIIRDAIRYEISRGGQVYFVHNRVQNILDVARIIDRLMPGIRVAIGHGQMKGHELEQTMLDFIEGYYDVLVATTIIESGLDIPNVNTIIINDAHNYGLSELHQLRGRVGRSNKKAFCYLLAPPLSVLTPEARKRLKAIEEFSDLGSGFQIAMRDLDIRGAGNILGAEQSGFISEIGFEMYQKILDEAIRELKESDFKDLYKSETPTEFVRDCVVETDLEILIPDDYVSNMSERLNLYKELDNIETEKELMNFQSRLIDRFGPIPHQIDDLINTIRLRWFAKGIGLEKIVLKSNQMIGYFVTNQESAYYQTTTFTDIIKFLQQNPVNCRLQEKNNKLTILFSNISAVNAANSALTALVSEA